MNNKEKNPLVSFAYALNGISLVMNMILIESFFENKEDFPPFNSLKESFDKLKNCIQSMSDPEKKVNVNDIYTYGKKYLTEYKAFRKLPEVQEEYLQKILAIGINEINDLLDFEEKFKNRFPQM